jgi:FkbM family methyltransferase
LIYAIKEKVENAKLLYPNIMIYNECVSDENNKKVHFMITNNYESSSILNLKKHMDFYPNIYEMYRKMMYTKTIDTIFDENKLDPNKFNFMNIDIQGAELLALKGCKNILPYIDYIYCEVNSLELYEDCVLLPELNEFLNNNGFKLSNIQMTTAGWGDAFYVRESIGINN